MIYIVDAYNFIHKVPRLEVVLDRNLKAARDALVSLCRRAVSSRGDIARIILVFDGRSEFRDLPQAAPPKIEIVFSDTDEEADERIITILERLSAIPNKCVVSDDNFVRNHARAYRARSIPATEFEKLLSAPQHSKFQKRKRNTDETLPADLADEITEAYKKELGLD